MEEQWTEEKLSLMWKQALTVIKKRLSPPAFRTWFKNMAPVAVHEGFFILSTPSHFSKEWVESRHLNLIQAALREATGADFRVKIAVQKGSETTPSRREIETIPLKKGSPAKHQNQLNPRYTFEAFVVGSGNRFAHAAALAVAENPATAYNPLFVYGGAGLGKTHLLHAIGHRAKSLFPHNKIRYVTSEVFTNEFINSIRDDRIAAFQERYRSSDILLIDDIHFIVDKERTQEEFFHTFNTLYEAHKQIVISSDRPPKDMPTLEERLRSRFEWGLITDIQPPDLETRMAILRKKAELYQINLPNEVVHYIASKIRANIRELEGALTRLVAFSSLTRTPITLDLAQDILKEILPEQKPTKISIKTIQTEVARYYSLSVEELRGKGRSQVVVFPRQIAMYLARKLTDHSLPKIGKFFGGRDHTTILHANTKVERLINKDKRIEMQVQEIINRIKQKSC